MPEHPPTNLESLRPSRKALQAGDVFVMKLRDQPFLFGRIVDTDAYPLRTGGMVLVYVYDAWSNEKNDVPLLDLSRLLVPPAMINRLGWTRGYFEVVEHRPLGRDDVLPVHCFVTHIYTAGPRYFDEKGKELPGPVEPVGQRGLGNYLTLENDICQALGIPPAPDE